MRFQYFCHDFLQSWGTGMSQSHWDVKHLTLLSEHPALAAGDKDTEYKNFLSVWQLLFGSTGKEVLMQVQAQTNQVWGLSMATFAVDVSEMLSMMMIIQFIARSLALSLSLGRLVDFSLILSH